jgi:cobaltochelatase CobN
MEAATNAKTMKTTKEAQSGVDSSGGSSIGSATVVSKENMSSNQTSKAALKSSESNQTSQKSDSGYGTDSSKAVPETQNSADPNYVEGYEMQNGSAKNTENSGVSFSGSDIVGVLFVIVAVAGIYLGFFKKKI